MKNYKHTRTVQDNLKIKGFVSEDGASIIYENDGADYTSEFEDIMRRYAGEEIVFAITVKDEKEVEDD